MTNQVDVPLAAARGRRRDAALVIGLVLVVVAVVMLLRPVRADHIHALETVTSGPALSVERVTRTSRECSPAAAYQLPHESGTGVHVGPVDVQRLDDEAVCSRAKAMRLRQVLLLTVAGLLLAWARRPGRARVD